MADDYPTIFKARYWRRAAFVYVSKNNATILRSYNYNSFDLKALQQKGLTEFRKKPKATGSKTKRAAREEKSQEDPTEQPYKLIRYWLRLLAAPSWEEFVIENCFCADKLMLWMWRSNARFGPALFLPSTVQGPPDNFRLQIQRFKLAIRNAFNKLDKPKDTYFDDLDNWDLNSLYSRSDIKFHSYDLQVKKTKVWEADGRKYEGVKVMDVIYQIEFKVFPYFRGHICNTLPMPGEVIGERKNERVVSSSNVVETMRRLSDLWENDNMKTVLVSGGTGSGKEAYAQAFHAGKERHGKYVVMDMSNSNVQEMQEKLFGRSISGAYRPGKLSEAEGGTLFLDEINKASDDRGGHDIRSMLLRPLEAKEYFPVDALAPIKVNDMNWVFASSQSIKTMTAGKQKQKKGPVDLWNRMGDELTVKHPLKVKRREQEQVVKDFVKTFYWDAVCGLLGRKEDEIIKAVWTKVNKGAQQPPLYRIATEWESLVFQLQKKDDKIVIKEAGILKDLCLELINRSLGGTKRKKTQYPSVRAVRECVSKIARTIYSKINEYPSMKTCEKSKWWKNTIGPYLSLC